MEKKLKKIKNGQGFVCKDLVERNRIWKKLEDAGYPMFHKRSTIGIHSYLEYPHIVWQDDVFCFCKNAVSMPLNEDEFFYEGSTFGVDFANTDSVDSIAYATHDMKNEWKPKPGEWVEVSLDGIDWDKRQYLCTIDGFHLCVYAGEVYNLCSEFGEWAHIRQIPLETMTRQEAQEKLSELLGKPNLIIIP
jgi:hypothetical protein